MLDIADICAEAMVAWVPRPETRAAREARACARRRLQHHEDVRHLLDRLLGADVVEGDPHHQRLHDGDAKLNRARLRVAPHQRHAAAKDDGQLRREWHGERARRAVLRLAEDLQLLAPLAQHLLRACPPHEHGAHAAAACALLTWRRRLLRRQPGRVELLAHLDGRRGGGEEVGGGMRGVVAARRAPAPARRPTGERRSAPPAGPTGGRRTMATRGRARSRRRRRPPASGSRRTRSRRARPPSAPSTRRGLRPAAVTCEHDASMHGSGQLTGPARS